MYRIHDRKRRREGHTICSRKRTRIDMGQEKYTTKVLIFLLSGCTTSARAAAELRWDVRCFFIVSSGWCVRWHFFSRKEKKKFEEKEKKKKKKKKRGGQGQTNKKQKQKQKNSPTATAGGTPRAAMMSLVRERKINQHEIKTNRNNNEQQQKTTKQSKAKQSRAAQSRAKQNKQT